MADVLVCRFGYTDLRAAEGDPAAGVGPVGQAVRHRSFDTVQILSDRPASHSAPYPA